MIGESTAVGDVFRGRLVEHLSRPLIAQYAGASGDFNFVHVDEEYAVREAGRSGVIAHGMLTMGLTATFLTSLAGRDSIRRFRGRFLATVSPGDDLDCIATVTRLDDGSEGRIVEFAVDTVRSDGRTVFSGSAIARLP